LVPKIPKRSIIHDIYESNADENPGNGLACGESTTDLTDREKNYREWLAESVELHHGALMNLAAEIENGDEREDGYVWLCQSRSNMEHLRGKYHCMVDLLFDCFKNVALCWVH